jgi:hypothetical protein
MDRGAARRDLGGCAPVFGLGLLAAVRFELMALADPDVRTMTASATSIMCGI